MVVTIRSPAVFFSLVLMTMFASLLVGQFNDPANEAAVKPTYSSEYVDVSAPYFVKPGENVTIQGYVGNASNTSDYVGSINVSANFTFGNGTYNIANKTSSDTGGFAFNITAPNMTSFNGSTFDIYLNTNSTSNPAINKTIKVVITNATNASLVYHGTKPPFPTNRTFTVNLTYFDGNTGLQNNFPSVEVFKVNGIEDLTFGVLNLSSRTSNGRMQYNISIPTTASGQYLIVVDKGLATLVFEIQAAVVLTSQLKTTSDEVSVDYAVNGTLNPFAIIRYSNGTPYSFNATDFITAHVTLPNGTTHTFNYSATNTSTKPGYFNRTFNNTNTSGNYKIKYVANIGGATYETSNQFTVRSFKASLETEKTFFREWGGKKIITPSSTVRFNVMAINTTDGSILTGSSGAGGSTYDCGRIRLLGFTNVASSTNTTWTGTVSYPLTALTPTKNVCSIQLGVPATVGLYRIQANVSGVDNETVVAAEGVVRVQEIDMKLTPIQAQATFMRGEAAFQFTPGENVTLKIQAFNFTVGTRGQEINGTFLNNVQLLSLRPVSFTGASSTLFSNFTENTNFWLVNVTERGKPTRRIIFTLPSSQTGFFEAEIQALINGQTVTGKAFFEAKYVEVHGGPQATGGFGGDQGFSPFVNCNGTAQFSFKAFDLKTRQNAQGVTFNGIIDVRTDEGKDFTSALTLVTNSTGQNGNAVVNVTFNTGTQFLDAHYFMLLNVSYNGNQDTAFSSFVCQTGFGSAGAGGVANRGSGIEANAFPSNFKVGPDMGVSFSVNNVRLFGQTNPNASQFFNPNQNQFTAGLITILSVKVFSPQQGGEKTYAATTAITGNISGSQGTFQINPENFSLTTWPIGFVEVVANITNASDGVAGHSGGVSGIVGGSPFSHFGGFQVEAFPVFMNQQNIPSSISAGDAVSLIINASTNVSRVAGQNFTVRFMRYGFGEARDATINGAVLLSDTWNTTADTMSFPPGAESYNVTFVVPSDMETGPTGLIVIVNNTRNVAAESFAFTTIAALEVQTLDILELRMHARCRVLANRDQNGTLDNCFEMFNFQGGPGGAFSVNLAPRMNFTVLNTSFNASNGTAVNVTYTVASRGGQVCYKPAFNVSQRFGQFGIMPTEVDNTSIALFDNGTANVFDTVVLNSSNGSLQVISMTTVNSNHRRIFGGIFNMSPHNSSAFYAVFAPDCAMLNVINGTQQQIRGGFGGDFFQAKALGLFERNTVWYAPLKVLRGTTALSGAGVSIMGFANMSFGGVGFTNMLGTTNFNVQDGTSDSNGIAFVRVNVTRSGEYMAIWRINGTVSGTYLEETAKLQRDEFMFGGGAGFPTTIRGFNAYQTNQFGGFAFINSASQNVSMNLTVQYFNGTLIPGANVTMSGQVFRFGPPQSLSVQMYNATTGANTTFALSGNSGIAEVKFSKVGGWQQGEMGMFLAAVVGPTGDSELMPVGSFSFMGFAGHEGGGGCIPGQPCGPGGGPG